jgi:hypothetical protein
MTSNPQPVLQFGKKSATPGAFEHRWQPAGPLFAIGILALICEDFAMGWQPVARSVPGRAALAYGSGADAVSRGLGLDHRRWAHCLRAWRAVWRCARTAAWAEAEMLAVMNDYAAGLGSGCERCSENAFAVDRCGLSAGRFLLLRGWWRRTSC